MRGLHWDKSGLKHGAWSPEEDELLISYIRRYKIWNWSQMPKFAGLARSGKSCRLRWMNYLRPDLKRGNITEEEEEIIVNMYAQIGSRWSKIAARLPGRTDNEIKNYWHTNLKNSNKNPSVSRSRKQKSEAWISEIAETNIVGSNESDNTSVTASEGSNESNITSITASEGSNSKGSSRPPNIACSPYIMPIADSSSSTTYSLQPWTEESKNVYVFNSNDHWFNLLLQSSLNGAL